MRRLVIFITLLMLVFPVFAEEDIIQSQILENCTIDGKTLRYVKIVNCNISNSEIYSAEIVDSRVSGSNVHEVDIRHSEINGGTLRNVYTTGGSVVRNAEVWTSTIEGTYIDHSSGGQVTIREGDVNSSQFHQANVNNASITNSELSESTTRDVDIRINSGVESDNALDIAVKTGSVNDEEIDTVEAEEPQEDYVIVDDKPAVHSNIPPAEGDERGFWKTFFCFVPGLNMILSC